MNKDRLVGWVALTVGLVGSALTSAAGGSGYESFAALTQRLKEFTKANPNLVSLESIGRSAGGRELWLLTITDRRHGSPGAKPAVFVVGNLEGQHVVGSELAIGFAEQLVHRASQEDSVAKLLVSRTFYILPRANPDGAEYMFRKVRWEHPEDDIPWDDDYDDVSDEDGPEDLNGDGWITQMRVRDPEGNYRVDPQDPRLLVKVNRARGEKGEYKLYTEGLDNDGDGSYNEDGPGGVNPDRNFPRAYPYNQPGAGRYQLQAPEAKAIVDFLLAHRNVGASLVFCLHDNLLTAPKPERPSRAGAQRQGMRRRFSREPASGLDARDLPYYTHVSHVYKRLLGIKGQPLVKTTKPAGAFYEWAYYQYGIPAFATVGWFPTLPEKERRAELTGARARGDQDRKGERGEKREKGGQRRFPRSMRSPAATAEAPGAGSRNDQDRDWLKWLDRYRSGMGFAAWQPVKHPTLGEVEVGGFLPFVRTNPPDSALPRLAEAHARFAILLAKYLPRIRLAEVKTKRLASGIYKVELVVENDGYFPTVLAHAARARAVKPTRVEVKTKASLLTGRKITFLDPIPGSGGRAKAEWIFKGRRGEQVNFRIVSEKAGVVETTVMFK